MIDREKVIKGLEWILADDRFGFGVNWETGEPRDEYEKAGKVITNTIALLKEQEAIRPVHDKKTGRVWLCGNCGSYVGFEDHDEDDPNEFDKFCRECGHPVLWEGR